MLSSEEVICLRVVIQIAVSPWHVSALWTGIRLLFLYPDTQFHTLLRSRVVSSDCHCSQYCDFQESNFRRAVTVLPRI